MLSVAPPLVRSSKPEWWIVYVAPGLELEVVAREHAAVAFWSWHGRMVTDIAFGEA